MNISSSNSSPLIPNSSLIDIPGVDVKHGIAETGGTLDKYCRALSMFCKDADERLPILKTTPDIASLPLFITQVHALKSALETLGASKLSAMAGEMEAAGNARNLNFVREKQGSFMEQLTELADNIRKALALKAHTGNDELNNITGAVSLKYMSAFRELTAALNAQDAYEADRILEYLKGKPIDPVTKEALEKIQGEVLKAEYETAAKIIKELLV